MNRDLNCYDSWGDIRHIFKTQVGCKICGVKESIVHNRTETRCNKDKILFYALEDVVPKNTSAT